MKKQLLFLLVVIVTFLVACTQTIPSSTPANPQNTTPPSERTSTFAIIIKPEEFDGQEVTCRGALYIDDDGLALYATPDDGEYMVRINALWLGNLDSITVYTPEELKALDGAYVELTATVVADKQGPDNAYNCEMKDVKKIQKLEPVNQLPE
ncbi:hypothetical protein LJC20_05025 [Eubacteriales bacterium OttesenSCG-928-M02]|nr:hypothetical protein [Eubacteriales bacterium OttesenSCG-928-M02]